MDNQDKKDIKRILVIDDDYCPFRSYRCPICYGRREIVRLMACDHKVCFYCVIRMVKHGYTTCPICRQDLVTLL